MSTKSDFAQKLLNDLRTRKERMAAAQNSSRQSSQKTTSRVVHGNTNTNRRHTAKPTNTREPSSQMVLYESQHQQQLKVGDLSMAIAFAFESNGASTTSNPLANFFNQFNRRSRGPHKTDIMPFGDRGQYPAVSNIHITQVSKGVQKLNRILRACSNGFSLDGKELLKGAIDLEESLRMLVGMQEGSQYGNNALQNKSRLRLLDDDEDDEDAKIAEQWKLDRPKFSFDKNPASGANKRSTSYVQDLSLSISSQSEKRGISNVVAKLMGLQEIPHTNEDFRLKKNDPRKQSSNSSEALSRESNKRQSHAVTTNQVTDHRVLSASQRKQNPAADKQSTKGQTSKTLKAAECRTHERIRHKLGNDSMDKEVARNQRKPEEKVVVLKELVPKRGEHLEDAKRHKEKKDQHFQRKISKAKNQESLPVKSIIPSKPKKSTAVKKKLPRDESTKPNEEVHIKDQKSKIHQVDALAVDISKKASNECIKKEDEQVLDVLSTREPQLDIENEKRKPKEQNQAPIIPRKVQSDIPRKIDVLMSRRNVNHLTRSMKQPSDSHMLKDLKQRLHGKNRFRKRTEEQRHDNKLVNDENAEITNIHEQVRTQEMLQKQNKSTAEEYQIQNLQKASTPKDHYDTTSSISGKASVDYRKVEHPYTLEDEEELKQRHRRIDINIKAEAISEPHTRQEQLTEPETKLKEIVIKSQTLLSTADALFKLNIPVSLLHAASEQQEYEAPENKLVLDCANEVMRRKAMRHTYDHRPKARSLDDLIRQVSVDLETLKSYGGDANDDVVARLHGMVERDIFHRDVDVNCMWEFEWTSTRGSVEEKEDVVREVERWVFHRLVDDVTTDLVLV